MNNRIIKIFLSVLFMMPLMSYSQTDPVLLKASFLFQQNELPELVSLLNSYPGNNTDASMWYLLRAKSRYHLNDFNGAREDFSWLEQNGESGLASIYLARIAWLTGDRRTAFEKLRKHLASNEKLPYSKIIGDSVFKDLERDREWISFWSDVKYEQFDDLLEESNYQLSLDSPDTQVFTDFISKYPESAMSWDAHARFMSKQNNKRRAESDFESALKINSNNTSILTNYADFLAETDKFNEALNNYQKVLDINPYLPDIWIKLISTQIASGKQQDARYNLNKLDNIGIATTEIWFMMASQNRQSNPEKAIEYLDKLILGQPLQTDYYNLRALLFHDQLFTDQALSDWAMSLDINPEQSDVYFSRAQVRYDIGDYEGACHDWKKAFRYGHRKALDKLYKYCKSDL
ncbi:MAG: hypothetical protein HOG34_20050 [Bacteroidetes bacterium]|nr:hypothetical protein [Bacteroidota bacterium]